MKPSVIDLAKLFGKVGRLIADFLSSLRDVGGRDAELIILLEDPGERESLAQYVATRAQQILPHIRMTGISAELTSQDGVRAEPIEQLMETWSTSKITSYISKVELGQPPPLPWKSRLCHASVSGPVQIDRLIATLELLHCRPANLWETKWVTAELTLPNGRTLILGSQGLYKGKKVVPVLVHPEGKITELQFWDITDAVSPGEDCYLFLEAPNDETIRLLSR